MRKKPSHPTQTVLTISTGFLVLYLAFHWDWAVWVALLVGLIGIGSDFLSKKIEYVWLKFAGFLALIVPNILLTAIFYLLLFPLALMSRWFGDKDPLFLKNRVNSTFTECEKEFTKGSFEKVW